MSNCVTDNKFYPSCQLLFILHFTTILIFLDTTRFFIRRWSEVDKEKSMKRRLEIIFFAAKASIINVRYRFKQLNFDFNFNLNTFEHLNINLNWKLCI